MDQQTQTEVQIYPGDRKDAKIGELVMVLFYLNRMAEAQQEVLSKLKHFSSYLTKFEEATEERDLLKLSSEELLLFEAVKRAEKEYRDNTETVENLRIAMLNRVVKLKEKINSTDEIAD